jgi:ubiquinone/menaquinone biosynthesis C-methylase UbiE
MTSLSSVPDFGRAANDYQAYRLGFPGTIMQRLAQLGVGIPGQQLLDLGTGTGLFANEFARAGCAVMGVDISPQLLEKARQSASAQALSTQFIMAPAEDTGLQDGTFDVITAATSWHWFDRGRAAKECMRLLKSSGRLVIAVLDWHFLPDNVLTKTFDLVGKYATSNAPPNLSTFRYPEWTTEIIAAGFNRWEMFGYVAPLPYTHEGWRGRVRASQGVGPVMDAQTLERFDREMTEMLRRDFPQEPMAVPHRIFSMVTWRA